MRDFGRFLLQAVFRHLWAYRSRDHSHRALTEISAVELLPEGWKFLWPDVYRYRVRLNNRIATGSLVLFRRACLRRNWARRFNRCALNGWWILPMVGQCSSLLLDHSESSSLYYLLWDGINVFCHVSKLWLGLESEVLIRSSSLVSLTQVHLPQCSHLMDLFQPRALLHSLLKWLHVWSFTFFLLTEIP